MSAQFPEIKVLNGSGNLFGAGAMRLGWQEYVQNRNPDYLLVFNDDIQLYPGAISALLDAGSELESSGCRAYAVAGAMEDPDIG